MMKVKRGLFASVVTASFFALAPPATAFDTTEVPLAFDALSTFAPGIAPPPNDGAHDFAVGGGQHDDLAGVCSNSTNNCVDEGFAAHSDPNGGNPQGHVSATVPHVGELKGPVTCLRVTGNNAFILFVQTKDFPGSPPGTLVGLHVVDNGNPILGTPPDRIRNYPNASTLVNPLTCFTAFLPPVPLVRGNITVRDVL